MHHQFGAEDFIWKISVTISHSLVRPEVLSLDWLLAIPLSIGAYLLGSIPSAYILVYMVRGVDIRQVGTRNVGAMNAFDQAGPWGGLLVLLADGGKGVLAALLPGWVGAPDWVVFLTATLALAGHNWPVFLNFRGGKGAAVILGNSLAVLPVLTMIAVGPTVLVILLARNVIIGAGLGFILLNTIIVVTNQCAELIALCLFLTFVATVTYVVSIWTQIITAIKTRHWRRLFYGPG